MLVEIECLSILQAADDSHAALHWQTKDGKIEFKMKCPLRTAEFAHQALIQESARGVPLLHGSFVQMLLESFSTSLEKIEIVPTDDPKGPVLAHFKTPAGTLERSFTITDGIAMALYARCPIFIHNSFLSKTGVEQDDHRQMEQAEAAAKSPVDDDLPKA